VANRDEQADTSKTGAGRPSRESKMADVTDYLVHAELVVTGNMTGRKKERPAG